MRADRDFVLDRVLTLLKTQGPLTAAELAARCYEEQSAVGETTAGSLARKLPRASKVPGRRGVRRTVDALLRELTEGGTAYIEPLPGQAYVLTPAGHALIAARLVGGGLEEEAAAQKAVTQTMMFAKEARAPSWGGRGATIIRVPYKVCVKTLRLVLAAWRAGANRLVWPERLSIRLSRSQRVKLYAFTAGMLGIAALTLFWEVRSSFFQSHYLAKKAKRLTYQMAPGASEDIRFPASGPFDQRLGYAVIPRLLERVIHKGFMVESQARLSAEHLAFVDAGLFPIYHEKSQAGLTIFDRKKRVLFTSLYPQLIYARFDDIPDVVVQTLLFIENRGLLDPRFPRKNPTLEWERLGRAVIDMAISQFNADHDVPGGSTLATQIEKYRHSPEGRTSGVYEKLRQMVSATFRAYQDGPYTLEARRRVVRDYINSVPLGAIPGAGEVRGVGHGLVAWHGANFARTNELLRDVHSLDGLSREDVQAKALAYKETLSLFLAQRRPAYYLQTNREALKQLTNRHLGVLTSAGIISERFRDAVAEADLTFRNNEIMFQPERLSFVERKAANAVRVHLLPLFGFDRLYTLDRLDLKVTSTIDYETQNAVTSILQKLKDPSFAAQSGLQADRLLARGDPAEVIYSFTLRERVGRTNVLRVQADNVDGPFNVSEGGKLELGSTAKLRTLISYLEVIEGMWARHARMTLPELKAVTLHPADRLGQWSIEYLQTAADKSLAGILRAAMDRTYSASPAEVFFTGGGKHRFHNFQPEDNYKVVTVSEALKRSINLPFVRMMRDVVYHHIGGIQGSYEMLQEGSNPLRRQYLTRFANKEGRQFLGRFFLKYRGMPPGEALKLFARNMRPRSLRLALASILSLTKSEPTPEDLVAFAGAYRPGFDMSLSDAAKTLNEMHQRKFTLHDKGYIANVHPLELWLVTYMDKMPTASFSQIMDASVNERQDVYAWLFNSKSKARQDTRIRVMLEQEAFQKIHQNWQRLGYPFSSLVPTYASSLGSSGDKPVALAELMGIIVGGGVRYTASRVEEMHFAERTPFETRLKATHPEGTRVLSTELAATVKKALTAVVEDGTAIRIKGAFQDENDQVLTIGGKTGTGDNRYAIYAPGGRVIESKVMSRTATFVFFIGDRFFGTLTAYVPDSEAGNYNFTSALPVQILKILAPQLRPLVNRKDMN